MSKKDFELIASIIRGLALGGSMDDPQLRRQLIAQQFAAKLADTNTQFKRDRFVDACMMDSLQ